MPDTERVGRGLRLCRDRASIVARACFDRRVDNSQPEKTQIAPPAAVGGEKKEKSNIFSLFSPQRRYVKNFGCFFKAIYLKKTFELRVSIGIGLRKRFLFLIF